MEVKAHQAFLLAQTSSCPPKWEEGKDRRPN